MFGRRFLNRKSLTNSSSRRACSIGSGAMLESLEPRLLLSGTPGPAYDVWGGFEDHGGDSDYYLNINQQGWDYLGSADVSDVFIGQYDYYVIAARYPISLDALTCGGEGVSDNAEFFNITNSENVWGLPDGSGALLGPVDYPAGYRGAAVIQNPGLGGPGPLWFEVEVNTIPLAPGPIEVFVQSEENWSGGNTSVDYEFEVQVGGVDLQRLVVITPWGEPFDSDFYLIPVEWSGEPFYYSDEVVTFEAWTEGPEQFFWVEWEMPEVVWGELPGADPSFIQVSYSGGIWSDFVDHSIVAPPGQVPNIVFPVDGMYDAPVYMLIAWDQWVDAPPTGGIFTEVTDVEGWYMGMDGIMDFPPPNASSWPVGEPLMYAMEYIACVEFWDTLFYNSSGVEVGVMAMTSSEISFMTEEEFIPPMEPDLAITNPSLSATQVGPGELVQFSYLLENWGDMDAGSSITWLYYSTDPSVDTSGTGVGGTGLGSVSAWSSIADTIDFNAPTIPGTYYYAAVADWGGEVFESNESNNWGQVLTLEVIGQDEYEPDDTPGQASQLPLDGSGQEHSIHDTSDVDWMTFTLPEASRLDVLVLNTGQDMEVWLYEQSDMANPIAHEDVSGGFDMFQIPGLAAGTYYLKAASYNHYSVVPSYVVAAMASVAAPLIEGHVYDYHTGQPLAGVDVHVIQGEDPQVADAWAWDHVTTVTTDLTGYYQILDLPDRSYRLGTNSGQTVGEYSYVEGNLYNVPAAAESTTSGMDLYLRHAGSIVGYVYGPGEQPLEGIEVVVEAEYVEEGMDHGWHNTWTDSNGRYELFLLETDLDVYPVKIGWAEDSYGTPYASQIAPDLYSAAYVGATGPDFHLDAGGWLIGHVEDSSGQPIANFHDVLEPHVVIDNGLFEDPNVWTDANGDFRMPVPADTDIYFITSGWSWGRYDPGDGRCAWGERWIGPYTVSAGATTTVPTLVVPEAITLSGTVTDPLGNPAPGVEVRVIGYDIFGGEVWIEEEDTAYTDASGNYMIDWVPAGQLAISGWADGYLTSNSGYFHDVPPGGSLVYDFTMVPADQGVVISGSIANFDQVASSTVAGEPLPDSMIDYEECFLAGDVGVLSYDPGLPWSVADLLFPDRRWTGVADAEDGYDDYYVLNGLEGTYLLTAPAGEIGIFGFSSMLTTSGGWSANLSDPVVLADLLPGQTITGQDLNIPVGENVVSGAIYFPPGYVGTGQDGSSVSIMVRPVGSVPEDLAQAIASPGPGGLYDVPRLADGTYYVHAVAEGLAPFISQTFTVSGGQAANIDIVFELPADLAFNAPAQTHIQVEVGSAEPLGLDVVNLGMAEPGPFDLAVYASDDPTVDQNDTPLVVIPPGEIYSGQWAFVAPDKPGTYYIAAIVDPDNLIFESDDANNWSDVMTLEVSDSQQVQGFAFADYYPLTPGTVRHFLFLQTDPSGRATANNVRSVVGEEPVQVNGSQATEVRKYLEGRHITTTFYSMDDGCLQLLGQGYPNQGSRQDTLFDEAFTMCPAEMSVGASYSQTGSWSGEESGGVIWSGVYQQDLTVVGFEQVVTVLGTFEALRLNFQVTAGKNGEGIDVAINDNYDVWMVEGLGVVCQEGVWTETEGLGTASVWTFRYDLSKAPEDNVSASGQVDLTARFSDRFDQPAQLIPGRRITVPVIVQNMGPDPVEGMISVAVCASEDQLLGQEDILLAKLSGVRVNLAAGSDKLVKVTFTVPDGLPPASYQILAYADADNVVNETWEDNNVAASGLASQYAYQFGNVAGQRNTSLTMLDQFGTPVTFSLRGNGYGEVTRNPDGSLDVAYYQTDARTTATIRSPRRTNGVINNVNVLSTEAELGETENGEETGGSLKSLNARGIDLTGDAYFDCWVGSVMFDDVATVGGTEEYDHTFTIAGGDQPVRLTFGSVGEMSLYSQSPLSRLIFSEWIDNSETRDRIVAPQLGSLLSRGDRRREIVGHFGADLVIDPSGQSLVLQGQLSADTLYSEQLGPTSFGTVLGNVKIAGDLYDVEWDITGGIGALMVLGRVEAADVRTTESMGTISFGAALESNFLAGVSREVTGLPESPEDIVNPDAYIKSVNMRPGLLPGTGESPFFAESSFAAGAIGKASLIDVIADNGGQPFGFFAGTIASITHRGSETNDSWTWRKQTDGVLSIMDFFADAFATPSPDAPLDIPA